MASSELTTLEDLAKIIPYADPDETLQKLGADARSTLLRVAGTVKIDRPEQYETRDLYKRIAAVLTGKTDIGKMKSVATRVEEVPESKETGRERVSTTTKRRAIRETTNVDEGLEQDRQSFGQKVRFALTQTVIPPPSASTPISAPALTESLFAHVAPSAPPSTHRPVPSFSVGTKRKGSVADREPYRNVPSRALPPPPSPRKAERSLVPFVPAEPVAPGIVERSVVPFIPEPVSAMEQSLVPFIPEAPAPAPPAAPVYPYKLTPLHVAGGGPFSSLDYATVKIILDLVQPNFEAHIQQQVRYNEALVKSLQQQIEALDYVRSGGGGGAGGDSMYMLMLTLLQQRMKYQQTILFLEKNHQAVLTIQKLRDRPEILQCLQLLSNYYEAILQRSNLELQTLHYNQDVQQLQQVYQQMQALETHILQLRSEYLQRQCGPDPR